ncbi:MAG: diacylglycerol kinase family lipid kinase [Parvibaculaceae bacterium]|nr:diacylglycerol kinase family lipid kinase [Parvibaculaceae bacterium]
MVGGMPHVAAIVNPRSGGGRTGRAWRVIAETLEKELGPIRTHFTGGPSTPHYLPAAELAQQALHDNAQLVIAVGGDGTIDEVVNGFFEAGAQINPDAHLAVLNAGTGGDFRRTFDLPQDAIEGVKRIAKGTTRQIDIGRLTFIAHDGQEKDRYFNNIASFGLSGETVHAVNNATWQKSLGGNFVFTWGSLVTALRHKTRPVRITTDHGFETVANIGLAAVANGRYFGSGMKVAPDAEPDDGLFDLVIMRDLGFMDLLTGSGNLRDGTHVNGPKVTVTRARTVTAVPLGTEPVLIDVDGEGPGRLPAHFEILPGAITLRC